MTEIIIIHTIADLGRNLVIGIIGGAEENFLAQGGKMLKVFTTTLVVGTGEVRAGVARRGKYVQVSLDGGLSCR